jgi:hypothetical protein
MGSRQFSAGCLVSALPACRNTLSIRQQQQADGLHAGMGSRHPMKNGLFYFRVELPETGMALTWIGGGLKAS